MSFEKWEIVFEKELVVGVEVVSCEQKKSILAV